MRLFIHALVTGILLSPSLVWGHSATWPTQGHCEHPVIAFKELAVVSDKEIALTFDDGPDGARGMTDKLIDTLISLDVPATFFVCGKINADLSHDVVAQKSMRRMAAAGFTIANHTTNHKHLPQIDAAAIEDEIAETEALVHRADVLGPSFPALTLLRAPYGQPFQADPINSLWVGPIFAHHGVHIGWNIDSNDWSCPSAACVEHNVFKAIDEGTSGVVLMHALYQVTIDALPTIVHTLRQRGYTFVSVEKLVRDKYGASSQELYKQYIQQCEPNAQGMPAQQD